MQTDIDYLATGYAAWTKEDALKIGIQRAFSAMIVGTPQPDSVLVAAEKAYPGLSPNDCDWVFAEANRHIDAAREKMLDRGIRAMELRVFPERNEIAGRWALAFLRQHRAVLSPQGQKQLLSAWALVPAWQFKPEGLGSDWLAVNVFGHRGHSAYIACIHPEPEEGSVALYEFVVKQKGNRWIEKSRRMVIKWEAEWA